jgi:TolB protein
VGGFAVAVALVAAAVGAAACGSGAPKPSGLIAFDNRGKVFIVNPDGSGRRRLTRGKAWQSFPDWSPDGKRIAFVESPGEYNGPWSVHVTNSDGSANRTVMRSAEPLYSPDWAPDGRKIAFDDGGVIWVVSVETRRARRLVSGRAPAWSNDGRRIAFGDLVSGTDNVDLFVVSADGSGPKERLTRIPDADIEATWSPDGKRLVFQHGNEDIDQVNADGTGKSRYSRLGTAATSTGHPTGR